MCREEGAGRSLTLLHPSSQVYEQLYDTLDITGSAEIRAHATAKVGAPHHSQHPRTFLMLFIPDFAFMIFTKSLHHPITYLEFK